MKTRQVILHNENPVELGGYFFLLEANVLPDGPTALGHPANEDLFAGTPVRAATSWRVYLFFQLRSSVVLPLVGTVRWLAYTGDGGFAMPREIDWTDTEEIGIQLQERFPEIEPYSVRFTDLHKYVTELPGFVGDPAKSNEGILEAIQTAWNEEYEDAK
jgi:FeS assembly protein IscX